MSSDPHPQAPIEVEHGDAVVPDADEAPSRDDLLPEDPPAGARATGDRDKKPSVSPPVPAHGESASAEQLAEATDAAEVADAVEEDT